MTTELSLENWRGGQTNAERMCLHLLGLEGFADLDPQAPIGGRDGRKDILCSKNGWRYVAAAYFPTEKIIRFQEIARKFTHDLEGVQQNHREGIVFLTGQKVTPAERKKLEKLANAERCALIIYHQERLRGILDSPLGFAARLEHLQISMQPEEQMSFVLALRGTEQRELQRSMALVHGKLDQLLSSAHGMFANQAKAIELLSTLSTRATHLVTAPPETEAGNAPADVVAGGPADFLHLTADKLFELHRILLFETQSSQGAGKLRVVQVWIGGPDSSRDKAVYTPPPPQAVPRILRQLLAEWNDQVAKLRAANPARQLEMITEFHLAFLNLHPFDDGNGRVARYLVQAQATVLELTSRAVHISRGAHYNRAILEAQGGNLAALQGIITQAVTGNDGAP